jgi:quercetin dioxygenase-like cupin family protein
MKKFDLKSMIGGWFIGDFDPSLLKTTEMEVSVKRYKAGDYESEHFHKVATEYTVIIEGEAEMSGGKYYKDDIIIISPNESTYFRAITDVVTVAVKIPGAKNDKYLVDKE